MNEIAHQPWSLGVYVAIALLVTVVIWVQSRRNRPLPHRLLTTLMAGIAAALSWCVWWIGQGEPNWVANQMYLVAFGALFVVAATLSVVSVALGRGNRRTAIR